MVTEAPTEPPTEPVTDPDTTPDTDTDSTTETPTVTAPDETTPNVTAPSGKGCRSALFIPAILPALLLSVPALYRCKNRIR